jgi:homoserine kinase
MTLAVGTDVKVFAPASIGNVGPGFDVLGLALSEPGDTVIARVVAEPGVRLARVSGDEGRLPKESERNTATIAAQGVLDRTGIEAGIEIELHKGMPIGSGLGSSAASAVAGAFAANLLLGAPLRRTELVLPCTDAEARVSGRHADNVSASLLGGLILIRSLDPLDLIRVPVFDGLTVAVVTPSFELPTREARTALPASIRLADHVRQSANLAAMIGALHTGDPAMLGRSLEDVIAAPARTPLIPGCEAVLSAALDAGALGSSISGAGPSIFALCGSRRVAAEAADAMRAAFERTGAASTAVISPTDAPGVRRL